MNKKPWDVHAFKKAFIAVWQLNSIYFVILWPLQLYATVEFHFEKNSKVLLWFLCPCFSLFGFLIYFLYKKKKFKIFLLYGHSWFKNSGLYTYWLNTVRLISALWSQIWHGGTDPHFWRHILRSLHIMCLQPNTATHLSSSQWGSCKHLKLSSCRRVWRIKNPMHFYA